MISVSVRELLSGVLCFCLFGAICPSLQAQENSLLSGDKVTPDKVAAVEDTTNKAAGAAKSDSPSTVSLKDLTWIAGRWQGEAMGGEFEETWNPPSGGSMIGMFKLVRDDAVVFQEFLTIAEEDGTLQLRVKHFDKKMVGWEEKDKSVEFPFIRMTDSEAIFDGLKFVRSGANKMEIVVRVKQGEETSELKFLCNRAKP